MTKPILLLLGLFSIGCLFANESGFEATLDSLVNANQTYMQAKSRYNQEKALNTIEKSLNLFDVNLNFQQYDNDFLRNETETSLEHSEVDEKDRRWRIELSKQVFSKDYDDISDAISSRLNLLRYRQAIRLAYTAAAAEITDDIIKWFEAEAMQDLINSQLTILRQQNIMLEQLDKQNMIDPELLIKNIEETEDKEKDLADYKQISLLNLHKYGDLLPLFTSYIQSFQPTPPDTNALMTYISNETAYLRHESSVIAAKIKRNRFNVFIPEVTLKLSYNQRVTDQDWDIIKNDITKSKTMHQKEKYPEGEIGISLPFNMFSNVKGKYALLMAYNLELEFRSKEMNLAWDKFASDLLTSYYAAVTSAQRKNRLKELYQRNLILQKNKISAESSLLGSNPELRLQMETLKTNKAEIESRVADMKLFRAIYLINHLKVEIR